MRPVEVTDEDSLAVGAAVAVLVRVPGPTLKLVDLTIAVVIEPIAALEGAGLAVRIIIGAVAAGRELAAGRFAIVGPDAGGAEAVSVLIRVSVPKYFEK